METAGYPILGLTTFIPDGQVYSPTGDRCADEEYEMFLFLSLAFVAIAVSFGIIGNVMVFFSVYDNKSLRSANNALLVNLAAADFMTCTLSAPISWVAIFWRLAVDADLEIPEVICSMQVHFYIMTYSVQLVTLALISLERHAAITHPFEKKMKKRRVILGIIFGWILGLLLGILSAIYLPGTPIFIICTCTGKGDTDASIRSAHLYILTPLGIFCFIVILYYYLKIYLVVRKHVKDRGINFGPRSLHEEKTNSSMLQVVLFCRKCGSNQVSPTDVLPPARNEVAVAVTEATVSHSKLGQKDEPPSCSFDQRQESVHYPASEKSSMFSRPDLYSCFSSSSNMNGAEFLPDLNRVYNLTTELSEDDVSSTKQVESPHVFRSEPNLRKPRPVSFIHTKPLSSSSERSFKACEPPRISFDGIYYTSQCMQHDSLHVRNTPHALESGIGLNDGTVDKSHTSSLEVPMFPNIVRHSSDVTSDVVSGKDENAATESQIKEVAESANVVGSVCVFNPKNRERGRRNAEAHTAKRAAYLIIVFSLCWIPLFILTLVEASPLTSAPLYVMVFFSCTVLFSSAANPVVYTVVNKSFREEFKKLLRRPAKCLRA